MCPVKICRLSSFSFFFNFYFRLFSFRASRFWFRPRVCWLVTRALTDLCHELVMLIRFFLSFYFIFLNFAVGRGGRFEWQLGSWRFERRRRSGRRCWQRPPAEATGTNIIHSSSPLIVSSPKGRIFSCLVSFFFPEENRLAKSAINESTSWCLPLSPKVANMFIVYVCGIGREKENEKSCFL